MGPVLTHFTYCKRVQTVSPFKAFMQTCVSYSSSAEPTVSRKSPKLNLKDAEQS